MAVPRFRSPVELAAAALLAGACAMPEPGDAAGARDGQPSAAQASVQIEYLEIVTPDVEQTCRLLESLRGVRFGEPEAGLGNARTAALSGGGRIGVRRPLRADEQAVVRPYVLVDDIEAAVRAAQAGGAQIAHPPLEIPGHGTFAIYFLGGIEHGLWQR